MSSGERPIGTAKGKQPTTKALCQTPQLQASACSYLLAYDCCVLVFGMPPVFTAMKWLSRTPTTPISLGHRSSPRGG